MRAAGDRARDGVMRGSAAQLFVLALATTASAQPRQAQVCVRSDAGPFLLALDGGTVKFCLGSAGNLRCYSEGLADGALATFTAPAHEADQVLPARASDAMRPQARVEDNKVSATGPDGTKKTIVSKIKRDPEQQLSAIVNGAGTLLAVWGGTPSRTTIETYDLVSGKRLASFKAGTKHDPCASADFAGDTLVVDENNCAGPDDTSWLTTKTGKRIAKVGGKAAIATASATPVQIKGTLWAFNSATGDVVVLQDVKTGAVAKTIRVGAKAETAMVGDDRRLVLVLGGDHAGSLVVIDLATDTVTRQTPATCP